MDGDARGGAALSMRAVTGKPIKFAGVGEALDKLEAFHPERVAGRILGMGDVVSLVERAAETIKVEEAEKLAAKMAKGKFDLDDLCAQLAPDAAHGRPRRARRHDAGHQGHEGRDGQGAGQQGAGPHGGDAVVDDGEGARQARDHQRQAQDPRRQGRGTTVQEINKLLKMHQEMATAMKRLKKMGGLGKLAAMFGKGGWKARSADLAPPGALPPGVPGLAGAAPASPALAARRRSTCLPVSTNFQRNRTILRKEL